MRLFKRQSLTTQGTHISMNNKLKLVRELAYDKNGKVIYTTTENKDGTKNREENYKQHDALNLMFLLRQFDSRKHTLKEYKQALKLMDKAEKAWRDDVDELELSLDEGSFLKEFLLDLFDKTKKDEEKTNVSFFTGKTIVSVLEQLGD